MYVGKIDRLLSGCGVFEKLAVSLADIGMKYLLPDRWEFSSKDDEDTASDLLSDSGDDFDFKTSVDNMLRERTKMHLVNIGKALNSTSALVNQAYSKIQAAPDSWKSLRLMVKESLIEVTNSGFGKEVAILLESNNKLKQSKDDLSMKVRDLLLNEEELLIAKSSLESRVSLLTKELDDTLASLSDVEHRFSKFKEESSMKYAELEEERDLKEVLIQKQATQYNSLTHEHAQLNLLYKAALNGMNISTKDIAIEREKLNREIETLSTELGLKTSENEDLSRKLFLTEISLKELNKRFIETETLLSVTQKDKESALAQSSHFQTLCESVTAQVDFLNSRLSDLMKSEASMSDEYGKMLNETEELRKTTAIAKNDCALSTRALAVAREDIEKLNMVISKKDRAFRDKQEEMISRIASTERDTRISALKEGEEERLCLISSLADKSKKYDLLLAEIEEKPEALLPPLPIQQEDKHCYCHSCKKYLVLSQSFKQKQYS